MISAASAQGYNGHTHSHGHTNGHAANSASQETESTLSHASVASSSSRFHQGGGGGGGGTPTASTASHGGTATTMHSGVLPSRSLSHSTAPTSSLSHQQTQMQSSASAGPSTSASASSPSSNSSPLYQPLALADAIARSNGDLTRALDDVLAERNKYCLEAGKLSNENIRIWNLMGRIRKENDALKARISMASSHDVAARVPSMAASDSVHGSSSSGNNGNHIGLSSLPRGAATSDTAHGSTTLANNSGGGSNYNSNTLPRAAAFNPTAPATATATPPIMPKRRVATSDASQPLRPPPLMELATYDAVAPSSSMSTPIPSPSPMGGDLSPSPYTSDLSHQQMQQQQQQQHHQQLPHSATLPSSQSLAPYSTTTMSAMPASASMPFTTSSAERSVDDADLMAAPSQQHVPSRLSDSSSSASASAPGSAPASASTSAMSHEQAGASVMQQRAAAKALQQSQQARQPGASSGSATAAPAAPQRRSSLESQDDYVAVDSSTIGGNSEDGDGVNSRSHSRAQSQAQGQSQHQNQQGQGQGRNMPYTPATPTAAAPLRTRASQGSVSSASHTVVGGTGSGGGVDPLASPRPRRKDLSAMYGGGGPSSPMSSPRSRPVGLPSSTSYTGSDFPGSPNAGGTPRRMASRRLEPRDATTRDDSLSLVQALAAAAAEGPPGEMGGPMGGAPQPRLDNTLLRNCTVKVSGTNLRTNDRGREVISFFLTVDLAGPLPPFASPRWKIEKLYSDVLALDAKLKHKHGKVGVKKMSAATLPDKGLFKDHAPSKVDTRKIILSNYIQSLLNISLPDKDDLCTFLCTDIVPMKSRDPNSLSKDGFLTKKGQNLGRWVTRFYSLDRDRLDYFEGRGGPLLGSINIKAAQIGRQQRSAQSEMDENSYRHAFLVLEKRPPVDAPTAGIGSESAQLVRHVLCAESDEERDEWVDVLVRSIAELERIESGGGSAPATATEDSAAPSSVGHRSNASSAMGRGGNSSGGAYPPPPAAEPTPRSSRADAQRAMPGLAAAVGGSGSGSGGAGGASPGQGSISGSGAGSGSGSGAGANASAGSGVPRVKRSGSLSRKLRSREGTGASTATEDMGSSVSGDYAGAGASASGSGSGSGHATVPAILPAPAVNGASTEPQPSSSSSSSHAQLSANNANASSAAMRPSISGPMNGAPIPTGYKFGAKDEPSSVEPPIAIKKDDKRRFWHRFGGSNSSTDKTVSRALFGIPLAESIAVSSVSEGLALPSVVYRCIEYLEKKNAVMEEGIYRLSGSSAVIKALRDRFNQEGDVDLLNEKDGGGHYDPHAIAGLLKMYLRELPTSVLTRELHLDFMRVNDIVNWKERIRELSQLVSSLPLANYSLLRTLCQHLIKVISFQDINKMTMRNVGIVFSPTLGIPAGVFALFLTSFDYCFYTDARGDPAPRAVEDESQEDVAAAEAAASAAIEATTATASPTSDGGAGAGSRRSWTAQAQAAQRRSNRNSLSYSEEEANRLMGAPSGQHKVMKAHPEDTDAEAEGRVSLAESADLLDHEGEGEGASDGEIVSGDASAGAGTGTGHSAEYSNEATYYSSDGRHSHINTNGTADAPVAAVLPGSVHARQGAPTGPRRIPSSSSASHDLAYQAQSQPQSYGYDPNQGPPGNTLGLPTMSTASSALASSSSSAASPGSAYSHTHALPHSHSQGRLRLGLGGGQYLGAGSGGSGPGARQPPSPRGVGPGRSVPRSPGAAV